MATRKRSLPPALAKRASALAEQKKHRLVSSGQDLVAVVRQKQREITAAFYEIGRALRALAEEQQFGAMGYATFDALLKKELGMSLAQADRLQECTRRLDQGQASDLGYEKSMAVTEALALPGASLTGTTLVIGKKKIDTSHLTAKEIEQVVTSARHARQKTGKPLRGKTTTPRERADAVHCQAELRRAGARSALVHTVATKPGQPADLVIRLRTKDVSALSAVHWKDKFG